MNRVCCLNFILAILGSTGLVADSSLSEAEFLSRLDEEHPAIVEMQQPLGVAHGNEVRAKTLSDPVLVFNREAPDTQARETVWGIAWTPPLDGRRGPAIAAATAGLEAAEGSYRSDVLAVRLRMRADFADWAVAQQRKTLLEEYFSRLESIAQRMDLRAEQGEEALLDARRFELAAVGALSELGMAEAELLRANARARSWRPDLSPGVDPALPALAALPAGLDLSLLPALAIARSELEQAEAEDRLGRRFVRFPELALGWQTVEDEGFQADGPVIALGWTVPLFDRGRADRARTQVAVRATQARLQWWTQRAGPELEGAIEAYESLRAVADRATSSIRDVDSLLKAAAAAFALGERTATDLLDTLRSALDTQLSVLELQRAALEEHRRVEAASGRSLPLGGAS